MTAAEILKQLKSLGSEQYRKILGNHGINGPAFGVKIEELKKIQKKIKRNYQLSLDLFDTGIYDAQYLAGLIADDDKMTKTDLQNWIKKSKSAAVSDYVVARVAAESPHGRKLANSWIDAKRPLTATAGWAAWSCLVALTDDADLDLDELTKLLARVQKTIHAQPDMVRYTMNGFVISLGSYVKPLTDLAIRAGEKIGQVEVDMGDTACQVPFAPDYIRKVQQRGTLGKKRKTVKC